MNLIFKIAVAIVLFAWRSEVFECPSLDLKEWVGLRLGARVVDGGFVESNRRAPFLR